MLRDDMELYTKLTGEDATHVPIMKIGAYLDGYEKGLSDKPSGEWKCHSWLWTCNSCNRTYHKDDACQYNYCPNCGAKMVEPQEREAEVGNEA